MSDTKLNGTLQFFLAERKCFKCLTDMLIEKLALIGEDDSSGTSGEKLAADTLLKLLDRLADSRLTDIEFFCCFGNIAAVGDCVKNAVRR